MSHDIAGVFFNGFAIAYAAEYLMSLYLLHSKASPDRNPALAKLHPAYTNPEIYKTVFPMLTAYAMLLVAVFWFYMSFSLFLEVPDDDTSAVFHDKHMATMLMGEMIYDTMLFTAVAMGAVAFGLRYIERGFCA